MRKIITIFCALTLAVSCNKEGATPSSKAGMGSVSFTTSVMDNVNEYTRAEEVFTIPSDLVPESEELIIDITGSYVDPQSGETENYSYGPKTLAEYNVAQPMLYASDDYTATFHYGESGVEGEDGAYYAATTEFEILARGTAEESVTVDLQNSIVRVECDDMFAGYYTDAQFKVTTGTGNSFTFDAPTDKLVFVEAQTTITIEGSATKVNGGSRVTFSPVEIGTTSAKSISRIKVAASSIGASNLTITLDDTLTEMEITSVELNPELN